MQKNIQRRLVSSTVAFDPALPLLLQGIYAARGVTSSVQLSNNLSELSKPHEMKGLAAAVNLLAVAVEAQKRVLIVGDFDADGATSSALAVLALRDLGLSKVDFLVPNRFEFGYGLTPEIVQVALTMKPDLIVTVDNGIASVEGVAAAKSAGVQVVVTDHHLPGKQLPEADAIVNPNQHGCGFPSKNLAGVGVIFYVMTALRTELRHRGWFERRQLPEPNMANYLDIVALGTVADVVPLDHNNRILVNQGLQRMRAGRARPGILALLEIAGRSLHNLVASDLGFAVGPRLNAAGRLDDMSLGIQCLLCDSPDIAREMAIELDDLNKDRRAIEAGMQQEALQSLSAIEINDHQAMSWGLCIYDPQWHQGVIGILASRIKEQFYRPVIAFADADENTIKGSARSIPGLHIRDALDAVASQYPGLLSKFGGHAMAAGLSLAKADYPQFQRAFDKVVRDVLCEEDLNAVLLSDGELQHADFDLPLAQALREAGPWGQNFPEPMFDGVFTVIEQRIVGQKHLKMVLSLDPQGRQLIDAIAFNVDLEQWPNTTIGTVKMVYRLDINEFRGQRSVQLIVEYLEPESTLK